MKATELQPGDVVRRKRGAGGTGTVVSVRPEGRRSFYNDWRGDGKPVVEVAWLHRHWTFATRADRIVKSLISPDSLVLVERSTPPVEEPQLSEDNLELALALQAWARRCAQD